MTNLGAVHHPGFDGMGYRFSQFLGFGNPRCHSLSKFNTIGQRAVELFNQFSRGRFSGGNVVPPISQCGEMGQSLTSFSLR